MRRLLVVLGVSALLVLSGGPAMADAPFPLEEQVVDRVGALSGNESQVDDAIDELDAENGTQLFVVFVNSFDGTAGTTGRSRPQSCRSSAGVTRSSRWRWSTACTGSTCRRARA